MDFANQTGGQVEHLCNPCFVSGSPRINTIGKSQSPVEALSQILQSSGPGADDTTSADSSTVARACGEARPLGIAKRSVSTASELAVSSGEAGPSWLRAKRTPSADVIAGAMLAGEARPPGIEKQGGTTDSDIAVSSGETGPSWSRANGDRAAATAAVKSAGKARPPGIAKQSHDRAGTRSEFR